MNVLDTERVSLVRGNCLEILAGLRAGCVDAIVTDPPYELGFMGKAWDATGIAFSPETWKACLRVLKPGGHLLAFGGSRTFHRIACAIEDAGFEIRDVLSWLYGTGFPKSLNGPWGGTALKPAWEPIILARKPLAGTVAANVAAHGTGGLNIDGCRGQTPKDWPVSKQYNPGHVAGGSKATAVYQDQQGNPSASLGRWPANVCLDEEAAAALDAQSGVSKSTGGVNAGGLGGFGYGHKGGKTGASAGGFGDSGGASRFFYVAKPSRAERDIGCEALPAKTGGEATDREDGSAGVENPRAGAGRTGGAKNFHPTVKPIALMRWLVRLVAPPGGVVLDPFTGSGTTGIAALQEGFSFVGIEREPEYAEIAKARISSASEAP